MNTNQAPAFRLIPKTSETFIAHSIPTPEDHERRRAEARRLLVEFLARHILAHTEVIRVTGEAA